MTSIAQEILVIGGGVCGLVCARRLAHENHRVRLVERGQIASADSCSWWAGGMLAPYCERENAEPIVVEQGVQAVEFWSEITPVKRCGTMVIAQRRDLPELDRFARKTSNYATIDRDQIASREPALAGRFSKGLLFEHEAHLDPRLALSDLKTQLIEMGVEIVENHAATAEDCHGRLVVDCRGYAARDSLDELRGVKGEMVLLRSADVSLNGTIRLLHPRWPIYVVPRGDGLFMVGATMIENEDRNRVSARSMIELLNAAYALHPAFAEAEIVEMGSDLRPAFNNNLPQIVQQDDRFFVNGMYRHGFLLSPAIAHQLAGQVDEFLQDRKYG